MTVSFVLGISILLQGTAAVLALLIIPLSRKALAWIFLSIAFFLMAVRRLLSLLAQENIISSDMLAYVHPEWVALGISVLMVAGVYHVRSIFQKRNQSERQMLREAYHDELTGLPNRSSFLELLEHAAEKAEDDPNYHFAVLFLDLDRFKIINDSLGHGIGDKMIVTVANMLRSLEKEHMKVARLGADEFTILATNIKDRNAIEQYADEIRMALAQPMDLDGYEVQTTVSIGIAFSSAHRELPEHILRDADTAMYQAKKKGKDCYEVFHDAMHDDAVIRLEMESQLRYAIERNELEIHYQPIVSLRTGRLSGFEALLRWNHPEMGLIMPDRFIPIAEETGLIIPIGEWVLRHSCKQVQLWLQEVPEAGALAISVNISSLQFSQKDFAARIINILQASGLQGHHLRLEITETALIRNVELAMNIFQQLHKAGILLYLDDFGTGYSSLSYLVRFPLDGLKIDRSFVQALDSTNERPEIVSAIIELANKLEIDVVAEGVEEVAQSDRLCRLNCEHAQGYYFSRPIPVMQATGLLTSHRLTDR